MKDFDLIAEELNDLINEWEPKLLNLEKNIISNRRNNQNRTIKEIVGHMIDSVSNNTHRIIHLQYQPSPLQFPDYANLGANDKWIAIQNYNDADWNTLVKLWKYSNKHFIHAMGNVAGSSLENIWISALGEEISLHEMITDYPRHFKLHLSEIHELMFVQK